MQTAQGASDKATTNKKQYDWTYGLTADEVAKITASAARANKVTERAVRNAVSRASGAGKRR